RRELSPPELVLVGEIPDSGTACCLLGELWPLPASYFAVESVDFSDDTDADPLDPFHAVARQHDTRIGPMGEDHAEWMKAKMVVFGGGRAPEGNAPDAGGGGPPAPNLHHESPPGAVTRGQQRVKSRRFAVNPRSHIPAGLLQVREKSAGLQRKADNAGQRR